MLLLKLSSMRPPVRMAKAMSGMTAASFSRCIISFEKHLFCARKWVTSQRTADGNGNILVATLLGISSTGLGTEKKGVWPSRAESSAYIVRGKDAWTSVTENRSFRFAEVLGDKGGYEALLLLEETFHNERTDGGEGSRGSVTVKAWSVKQGGDREIRRTLEEIGNEGERQDGFYRVTAGDVAIALSSTLITTF